MLGQLRRQHLESDQSVEALVAGQEHDAHATAPELPLDFVLAAQSGSDRGDLAKGGISMQ